MSAEKLKTWMQRTGMTIVDIASALKVHPNTVKRYLDGHPAHRSTEAAYERLITSEPNPGGRKYSSG